MHINKTINEGPSLINRIRTIDKAFAFGLCSKHGLFECDPYWDNHGRVQQVFWAWYESKRLEWNVINSLEWFASNYLKWYARKNFPIWRAIMNIFYSLFCRQYTFLFGWHTKSFFTDLFGQIGFIVLYCSKILHFIG